MHRQIQTGHHILGVAAQNGCDSLDHAKAIQDGCGQSRCADAVLLSGVGLGIEVGSGLISFLLLYVAELIRGALAHSRILPAFRRTILECRLILKVVQVGFELKPVLGNSADVVALQLAHAVITEAVWEVHVPSTASQLELGVSRQPFDSFLIGEDRFIGCRFCMNLGGHGGNKNPNNRL